VLSKHASQNSPSILFNGSCTRHMGGGPQTHKIIEICVVGMGPLEEE